MTDENLDHSEIEPVFETDVVVDEEVVDTTPTPVYTFTITERGLPEYTVSVQILEWLQENLAGLVDDFDTPIFGKVNTGFNENILKTFGKRPVCDIYINNVEYSTDFDSHIPIKVHTMILFYLKGANNHTYLKGCELHDLIMQEFISNNTFKRLDGVVRNTYIDNSEIQNQNIRGGYGVLGAFELTHDLY